MGGRCSSSGRGDKGGGSAKQNNDVAPTNQGAILGGEYGYFTEKGISEIIQQGGKRWTKGNNDRIYIKDLIETVGGLQTETYKSGFISSATLNGETISNSEAGRIFSRIGNPYINLINGAITGFSDSERDTVLAVRENITNFIKSKRYKSK